MVVTRLPSTSKLVQPTKMKIQTRSTGRIFGVTCHFLRSLLTSFESFQFLLKIASQKVVFNVVHDNDEVGILFLRKKKVSMFLFNLKLLTLEMIHPTN